MMENYKQLQLENQWEDLDKILLNESKFQDELPMSKEEIRDFFIEQGGLPILVIGAGGLGCEILKDLALSGFKDIHVIDLDTIDLTNLNRQFLFRKKDIGQHKSIVAANFVNNRVKGCQVTAHVGKIQDKDIEFYQQFSIILAGLDNVEARRWINSLVHQLVEWDENGNPDPTTVKALIDGGTEGFAGQARVIIPYQTACYECTLSDLIPQTSYNFCTISDTPRIAEHCIAYAYLIEWDKYFKDKSIDTDSKEDMTWIFNTAKDRADKFKIEGVTYELTMGVVKNIIPAIASTNCIIAAACANEALKIMTGCNTRLKDYFMYLGKTGINTNTFQYEKLSNCLVCSKKY